jgi:hypothetical protein
MECPLSLIVALTALTLAGAAIAAPQSAWESPPAGCEYLQTVQGDPDFVDELPEELPAQMSGGAFECWHLASGNFFVERAATLKGYQLASSWGSYVDLVVSFLEDPEWHYAEGSEGMPANADEWRELPEDAVSQVMFESDRAGSNPASPATAVESAYLQWWGGFYENSGFPIPAYLPDEAEWLDVDSGGTPVTTAYYSFFFPEPEPEPELEPAPVTAPSVLSDLPTVTEAVTPFRLGLAGGGAVALTLLMLFPSRLLSGVRDTLLQRAKTWWARWRAARAAAKGRTLVVAPARERRKFEGWGWAIGGLLLAGVVSIFLDPNAGFDFDTLRMLASILLAFAIEVALGWFVLIFAVGRTHPTATPWFTFRPWILVALVAVVLLTRLTGLQPGITFGGVAAVTFVAIFTGTERARFTFVGLLHSFVVAILGWIAYSLLDPVVTSAAPPWQLFIHETFAGLAIAGIALLPMVLLPLRGLPGNELFTWNRILWGASYVVGLVAFLVILLPLPYSWGVVPVALWAWVALFVLYSVVAVTLWLIVNKPWRPESTTAGTGTAGAEREVGEPEDAELLGAGTSGQREEGS